MNVELLWLDLGFYMEQIWFLHPGGLCSEQGAAPREIANGNSQAFLKGFGNG